MTRPSHHPRIGAGLKRRAQVRAVDRPLCSASDRVEKALKRDLLTAGRDMIILKLGEKV